MNIKQIKYLITFLSIVLTSIAYGDSKYMNLQIKTNATGFVENVHMNTNINPSLGTNDIKITTEIKNAFMNVGLIKDQPTQQAPHAWFTIPPQGGLLFNYVVATNYDTYIGRITDPELKQKVQEAHTAFQKYLTVANKSLGIDVTAELPGDVMLKNNPYSAPAHAMYKEMRKLAHAVGITLPDPDASILYTCVKWGLPTLLLVGSAYFLYSNWGNVSSALGTRTEQCGIGVQTVGTGISKGGGFVESFGRGVQKFGSWIKTPAAPKPTAPATPTAPTATSTPQPSTTPLQSTTSAPTPTAIPESSAPVPVSTTSMPTTPQRPQLRLQPSTQLPPRPQ